MARAVLSSSADRAVSVPPVDAWRSIARTLGRDKFLLTHDHPFLVVVPPVDDTIVAFFTNTGGAPGSRDPTGPLELDAGCGVLPVIKSGANPYAGSIIVGRARNCDLVLRDSSVSKVHAELRRIAGGVTMIRDLGSSNGVCVCGDLLAKGAEASIESGDVLRIGTVRAVFLAATDFFALVR